MRFRFQCPVVSQCAWFGMFAALVVSGANAQRPSGRLGPDRDREANRVLETDKGYLFVDGVFLPPPYKLELVDQTLHINGETYQQDSFDLSEYDRQLELDAEARLRNVARRGDAVFGAVPRGGGGRFAGARPGGPRGEAARARRARGGRNVTSLELLASQLRSLELGAIHVLANNHSPMELWPSQAGHDLLATLIDPTVDQWKAPGIPDSVIGTDRETWQHLVDHFEPTPELNSRAEGLVSKVREVMLDHEATYAANQWSERISYPLTIFALVVVVLAVGHLLTQSQTMVVNPAAGQEQDPTAMAKAKQSMIWTLVILGSLSMVDLVWTLIAHQSGSMRELNPLGNGLIEDPKQLIAFKVTLTSLSIGLLYWLHELPLARRASWWCCLVLTLLTARWLTFNSMFI